MLRIGLMGAAKIAPSAIIAPCKASTTAAVTAIGARDRARAEAFATKHGIARVHDSYDALLADADIDAVYIPLPNGLHGKWAIKAVQAGKHVLCEKPLAANEAEAQAMSDAADKAGRVMMEAFHYRYHPLAQRMKDIVDSGELGETREIFSTMCFPLPLFGDIRYNFSLGGGAMMDAGCYAVHMARLVGGGEPEVLSAKPLLRNSEVDRAMKADLRFPSGAIGHVHVSMWSWKLLELSLRVVGSKGEMRVSNPIAPQAFHKMVVKVGTEKRVERFDKRPSYAYQLDAFVAACEQGAPMLTPASDGVKNMRVIDAIYRAAGMPIRQPAA
jgi:predicted dehydrogenase